MTTQWLGFLMNLSHQHDPLPVGFRASHRLVTNVPRVLGWRSSVEEIDIANLTNGQPGLEESGEKPAADHFTTKFNMRPGT